MFIIRRARLATLIKNPCPTSPPFDLLTPMNHQDSHRNDPRIQRLLATLGDPMGRGAIRVSFSAAAALHAKTV
jgi:hypothetical protein